MQIRPLIDITGKSDLRPYGITEQFRRLMIFIDPKEYVTGTLFTAKAILISFAMETGIVDEYAKVMGMPHSRNNTRMVLHTYSFDVVLNHYGLDDLKGAIFTLKNAFSTENINNYDMNLVERPEVGFYDVMACTGQYNLLGDYELYATTKLPQPKYYTIRQQQAREHDIFSISSVIHIQNYEGDELIDDHTDVIVLDNQNYDSRIPDIRAKRREMQRSPYDSAPRSSLIIPGNGWCSSV